MATRQPRRRGPIALPPSGTITFAFTDIEGSTTRWEHDRIAMRDAVHRHDEILRGAITEHGGHVFKTIGDAFCSAFARPEDAVAAMLAAQRALTAEDFSAVEGLRVRAAIHTGTADVREGDYFGPAVNKVARLLAIGHGSQVLLTGEAAALVDGASAQELSLRDLGVYHLKDFTEPQRVHQLVAPGLPAEFPPLRSLGTLPGDVSIVDSQELYPIAGFEGRDEELAAVRAAFANEASIAVVHGLGGVGKSSVAREYGWRNREAYSVIWWLNAQTEDGIIDGLLRLGAMFVHGLDRLTDRRAAAQRVVNSILGGFDKPVLLVFDNLEDERLVRTWLPRSGARALVTSRNTAWGADVAAIPLHAWELDIAIDYLRRESGRADLSEADASAIALALGALPLALAHAAASLRNMRMVSAQRYLVRIKDHLRKAPRGAEYPRSIFATFSTAMAHAEQQAAGAAGVLCFAASFAPDAIPDELFRQPLETYPAGLAPTLSEGAALDLRSVLADDLRLDEALGALDRLSLLSFVEGSRTYSMHRLVQLSGQDLVSSASLAWRECAVRAADAAFPEVDFATLSTGTRLLPHARAALDALASDTAFLPAANLARGCGLYLRTRGEFASAEALMARALAIREKALSSDHLDVAQSLNGLATVYWAQGRYDDAVALHTRALAIQEKALGPDHPDVANTLNNLAVVYSDQGRLKEAEAVFTRVLANREKALGPDHPDTARSLNNLATVYYYQRRYEMAQPLYARSLAIWEKVRGPDHPDVALSLSNLANVHRELGRYEQAESLHTRGLTIWEKALGSEHPEIAEFLSDLALVYRGQGIYEKAEALHMRALAIREKALGPDHPLFANSLDELAIVYIEQGRCKEAEPLLVRALALREKALGPDHPKTNAVREELEKLRST